MATTYYKLVGTTNPHTNWTTEYRFRNEDGEVEKVVRLGEPVQLTAEERDAVKSAGLVLEASSKEEADKVEEAKASGPNVGSDVAGSAPLLGDSETPNQPEAKAEVEKSVNVNDGEKK